MPCLAPQLPGLDADCQPHAAAAYESDADCMRRWSHQAEEKRSATSYRAFRSRGCIGKKVCLRNALTDSWLYVPAAGGVSKREDSADGGEQLPRTQLQVLAADLAALWRNPVYTVTVAATAVYTGVLLQPFLQKLAMGCSCLGTSCRHQQASATLLNTSRVAAFGVQRHRCSHSSVHLHAVHLGWCQNVAISLLPEV